MSQHTSSYITRFLISIFLNYGTDQIRNHHPLGAAVIAASGEAEKYTDSAVERDVVQRAWGTVSPKVIVNGQITRCRYLQENVSETLMRVRHHYLRLNLHSGVVRPVYA